MDQMVADEMTDSLHSPNSNHDELRSVATQSLGEDAQAQSPRKTLRLTRSREKMDYVLLVFCYSSGDGGCAWAIINLR